MFIHFYLYKKQFFVAVCSTLNAYKEGQELLSKVSRIATLFNETL